MSLKEKKPAECSRRQPLTPEEESAVGGGANLLDELESAEQITVGNSFPVPGAEEEKDPLNGKITKNTTIRLF